MLRRRLRVAVPARVTTLSPRTGHGRIWREVLPRLGEAARLRSIDAGARARADVWLADGYDAAPPADGLPAVAYMSEGPPGTPDAATGLDPAFLDLLRSRGAEAAARATRIVCASVVSRDQITGALGVPPDRVDVVALGVDAERFGAADADVGRARVGAPYVLFASQLHPRKNLGALRSAMGLLAAGGQQRSLVLVSSAATDRADSADLEAAAFAAIPGVPVIRIESPDDGALADLMAGADAFCLPSLWEGFGLTALEAMAAGAVVVAADRGALPEVVGAAGVLAEPAPEPLAEALRSVLADQALAARLRAAGRERARSLSWDATASGWLDSLRRTVDER